MCWKRKKPEVITPLPGDMTIVGMTINDYPGGQNDLGGCNQDAVTVREKLAYWKFENRYFKDSEVTKQRFKNELACGVAARQPGDTVLMFMDCCFSEDNTRSLNKARFVATEEPAGSRIIHHHIMRSVDMNWIAFSACQDYETATDGNIGGVQQGIFTYYAMKALVPGITYRQWFEKTLYLISKSPFKQIPAMQGPDYLLDRVVFSGRTFVCQYSGHGTQVNDKDGDEADGMDEALYLYDGILIDDEIQSILSLIPN